MAFRLRPEVVRVLKRISRTANISQTRALEECILRQHKSVASEPFPSLAAREEVK